MKTNIRYKIAGHTSFTYLFNSLVHGAKKRKYEVVLSFDEFKKIVEQNCVYCGQEPKNFNYYLVNGTKARRPGLKEETINRGWIKVNGIDRFDNNKGYTLENSVPCCEQCNRAKLDYSNKEFLEWVDRVWRFNFWKN